jgi:four helix bundle protein
MVRDVRPLADRIGRFDRDHARQLRKSSMSVVLNVGEGSAAFDGRRRARYQDALGSARETLANLDASEAVGYLRSIDPVLRNRLNHIIGALVRLVC